MKKVRKKRSCIADGSLALSTSVIMFAVVTLVAGFGICYSLVLTRQFIRTGTFPMEETQSGTDGQGIDATEGTAKIGGNPDIGLALYDVTSTTQQRGAPVGVYVVSSDYCTELKNGDRILSVNGVYVSSSEDVETVICNCERGDVINIVVAREEQSLEATLTVGGDETADTEDK